MRRVTTKHSVPHLVFEALKSGRLVRAAACEECGVPNGATRATTLEGHHHDYTKPFDVTWYCKRCHAREHCWIRYRAEVRSGGSPLFRWMLDNRVTQGELRERSRVSSTALSMVLRGFVVSHPVAQKVLDATGVLVPSRDVKRYPNAPVPSVGVAS